MGETWFPIHALSTTPTIRHVPSPSELFSLLEHQHRRLALRYLLDHNCPVSLDAIATYLVEHEDVSADDRRRLSVELHHNHLPRLADYGCLRYDVETNTVEQVFDDRAYETSSNVPLIRARECEVRR